MAPPPFLTDTEWARICALSKKARYGETLTGDEMDELDSLGARLKLKRWPPPVIPPGQIHPAITIPIMIPAASIAAVMDIINPPA